MSNTTGSRFEASADICVRACVCLWVCVCLFVPVWLIVVSQSWLERVAAAAGRLPRARRRAGRRAARARRGARRPGQRPRRGARAALRRPVHRDLRAPGSRRTSATSSATGRCTASCPRSRRRAPRSRTRSATAAARAPSRCSSSWRATSPAGRPARCEFFELLATTQYMNHPGRRRARRADLRDHEALDARPAAGRRVRRLRPHRRVRGTRSEPAPGAVQHPERRHLPLARRSAAVSRSPLVEPAEHRRRFRFDPLGPTSRSSRSPRTEDRDHPPRRAARRAAAALALGGGSSATNVGRLLRRGPVSSCSSEQAGGRRRRCRSRGRRPHLRSLRRPGGAGLGARAAGRQRRDRPGARPRHFGDGARRGRARLAHLPLGMALPIGGGGYTRQPLASSAPVPPSHRPGGGPLQPLLDRSPAGGEALEILDSDRVRRGLTDATTTPAAARPRTTEVAVCRRRGPGAAVARRGDLGAARLDLAPRSTVVLDGLLVSGAPLVLEEVARRGDAAPRHPAPLHARARHHSRTPDGEPRRRTRASLIVLHPFASVASTTASSGRSSRSRARGSRSRTRSSTPALAQRRRLPWPRRRRPAHRLAGGRDRPATALRPPATSTSTRAPSSAASTHPARCLQLAAPVAPPAGDRRMAARCGPSARQVGCIRFSFVPDGSRTARRFHCAPATTRAASARVPPRLSSLRYGDPAYMQLHGRHAATRSAPAPTTRARWASRHQLYAPQRESNLLHPPRRVPPLRPRGRLLLRDMNGKETTMGADVSR